MYRIVRCCGVLPYSIRSTVSGPCCWVIAPTEISDRARCGRPRHRGSMRCAGARITSIACCCCCPRDGCVFAGFDADLLVPAGSLLPRLNSVVCVWVSGGCWGLAFGVRRLPPHHSLIALLALLGYLLLAYRLDTPFRPIDPLLQSAAVLAGRFGMAYSFLGLGWYRCGVARW